MSTTPHRAPTTGGRSATEVNEEIRALWLRTGGTLSGEQREEYQRLVLEWAAAYERASRTPQQPAEHSSHAPQSAERSSQSARSHPPADSRKAA
ncbi:hypothetical protein [Streptomyces ureilyticus]|uniref:Uncharacterized protein n=1 Tax=Streptomyces ureilyticus TaxID=1775131 RepID=A0ABX0DSI2_9ACTN|nr:hypothetical protein [Streptomyces ureilyticus]NGO43724.1 hypothetical protein [Streptomyces ureilyticus]